MRPAQSEVKEKGKRFGRGGGLFGDAGAAGRPMTQALVATAIAALAVPLHVRAVAALIVTAVPGVIAAVPAMSGRRQIKEGAPPTPERTVESVKTDMARIKESAQQ